MPQTVSKLLPLWSEGEPALCNTFNSLEVVGKHRLHDWKQKIPFEKKIIIHNSTHATCIVHSTHVMNVSYFLRHTITCIKMLDSEQDGSPRYINSHRSHSAMHIK